MSYVHTARSVTRVQQILDDLLAADGAREWPARNAHKLAYHIREAFAAAEQLAEFHKYAVLREKFIIRAENGKVRAEPRVKQPFEAEASFTMTKVSLPGLKSNDEAIGAAIKHNVEEVHLPDFLDNLQLLFKWTSANKVYIINHFGAGITLTRRRPSPEVEWLPS